MYTGTPALKTDFTRTGKRTRPGELNDAKNSLTRYYINNFTDGYNHDCLDLAQKKLTPGSSVMISRGAFTPMKRAFLFTIVALGAAHWFLNEYFPKQEASLASIESDAPGQSMGLIHTLCYMLIIVTIGASVFSKYTVSLLI